MKKESVSTVVFRCDGVLLDVDFLQTSRNVAEHLDVAPQKEDAFVCFLAGAFVSLPMVIASSKVTNELLLKKLGTILGPVLEESSLTADQVLKALKEPDLYACSAISGARDTVMYLYQKGYKLVSHSDIFGTVQAELLRNFGFLKYLEAVIGPIGSYYKPNPASMSKILRSSNPQHFLFVSNSLGTDLPMASELGMQTFWLSSSKPKQKMLDGLMFYPNVVISKPSDLQRYL